jgi:class 3 adenylate cyclase/tetratricopeptide (TPR) repeat protein
LNEIQQLEQAIAALEGQRGLLGDAVVDAALAPMRAKLAALQAQAAPPAEQKRKQVTVLFADVSGFTAMSEALDAEVVTEIMNALWGQLDADITGQGGMIDKHIGDCVMALWGVEAAREDDAERAINAALAMQNTLIRFREARGAQLAMRIGLNTGPVLLGEVGSRHEFTAMGDTVNLASRLEHAAPVGGVLISHDTYRLVRGVYEAQPQPPLAVKGKSEPVQTYVVRRPRPRTFHAGGRGIEGVVTPLVGRATELAALQAAFRRLVGPSRAEAPAGPACLTVVGDPGVGKSRLRFEFDVWLVAQGEEHITLRGRATAMQQHTPYAVLRDLLQEHCLILESDSAAAVRRKFEAGLRPHLEAPAAHLVGHLLGLGFEDTPAVKSLQGSGALAREAHLNLLTYFKALAAEAPVQVFLEDLHWVDDATVDFFTELLAHLQTAAAPAERRVLVIALARPTFFERRPEWGQGEGWQRLDLQPLSEEHSRQLVDLILARLVDPPEQLRQLIVERAEGNPFYLEELVMMLIGDGVIICEPPTGGQPGRWRIEPERLKTLRVPSTLVGVLQARLDSLPEAEKALLQRAAVIGRRFWDIPLEALATDAGGAAAAPVGPAAEALAAEMARLSARQLIYPQLHSTFANTHEFIFKHAILHDVVYETVLLKLRRQYHRRVAEWLEANCQERVGEYAALIATHYEQAQDQAKAFEWLFKAGAAAVRISAFSEGLGFLQRALALAPNAPSLLRARLFERLGVAYMRLGDMQRAEEHLRTAAELAGGLENWALASDAQRHLSFIVTTRGDLAQGQSLAASCLTAARQSGETAHIAAALMNYAEYQATAEATQQELEESLALYRQLGDRRGEATCLLNLGNFFHSTHRYPQARACYEQSLELYRQVNDRWGMANDLSNLGGTYARLGEPETAIRFYNEAIQIEKTIGDRESLCFAYLGLAEVNRDLGRPEQALANFRLGLVEAQAAEVALIQQVTLASLAEMAGAAGDWERAAWLLGALAENRLIPEADWQEQTGPLIERLAAALPAAAREAALARGRALGLSGVVAEVLKEN